MASPETQPNQAAQEPIAPLQNQTQPEAVAAPNNETIPAEPAVKAVPGKKRGRRIVILSIIILLILAALYFLFKTYLWPKPDLPTNLINTDLPVKTADTAEETPPAAAAATTDKLNPAIASSENYDLLQISLEGSGTDVFDFGENEILELSQITSELYSAKEGDKNEIRAVISCRTNKRAYTEVTYAKSGEKDSKIVKEVNPGFGHMLIVPALDPDSVYKYSIKATDLNQAQLASEQFVFYTGAGNISLVDILGSAVQKVFGWAIGE